MDNALVGRRVRGQVEAEVLAVLAGPPLQMGTHTKNQVLLLVTYEGRLDVWPVVEGLSPGYQLVE